MNGSPKRSRDSGRQMDTQETDIYRREGGQPDRLTDQTDRQTSSQRAVNGEQRDGIGTQIKVELDAV